MFGSVIRVGIRRSGRFPGAEVSGQECTIRLRRDFPGDINGGEGVVAVRQGLAAQRLAAR